MPVDLGVKVAHLIGDFWAVEALVGAIEHELERRIVARLGLIKLDALATLLPAYKNSVKRTRPGYPDLGKLEELAKQLARDHQGGIQAIRHSLAGHSLHLKPADIGEFWLFLKRSSFKILSDDLRGVDSALRAINPPDYPGARAAPPIPSTLPSAWRSDQLLGDPNKVRMAHVYAGIWSPQVVGQVPPNAVAGDATLRVVGLMTYLRQAAVLNAPIPWNVRPAVYRRLLYELRLLDLVALEEAIYTGPSSNKYGPTATSMLEAWRTLSKPHPGIALLEAHRVRFPPEFEIWKGVRNKVVAHVDMDVPGSDLDMAHWPLKLSDLDAFSRELPVRVAQAMWQDAPTRYMALPPTPLEGVLGMAGNRDHLLWDDTR